MANRPVVGLNFSHRRALALGLDPDEAFSALINDLRARCFRLSLYWDEIQPEPTRYDFSSVHRYLDLAERRGARILLTVGLRAPYPPWEYPPDWLTPRSDIAEMGPADARPRLVAHLLLMLERSVALLADYSAIDAWQLEVAPPPHAGLVTTAETLKKEYAAVAGCDPRGRPLVASSAGRSPLEFALSKPPEQADVLGQELDEPQDETGGAGSTLSHAGTALLGLRGIVSGARGRQFWITSLPVDPVTPERAVQRAARSGAQRLYIAGAERWQKQRLDGDPAPWESIRALLAVRRA